MLSVASYLTNRPCWLGYRKYTCLSDGCITSTQMLLNSFALPIPPDDDFSRMTAGGQKPVDWVSCSGLQPAVNLIASVLNVGEQANRKGPSFPPRSGVLVISRLFKWRDPQMAHVLTVIQYKCDADVSRGIMPGSTYCSLRSGTHSCSE